MVENERVTIRSNSYENVKYYTINTFKYRVFAPMGRFQLLDYLLTNCSSDHKDLTYRLAVLTKN